MSPELTQAIKERIAIGHSQEQIAAELKTAGYDDATIAAVYHAATQAGAIQSGAVGTTQPALATNPGGRLIGPLALLVSGFAVAASQWKGFVLVFLSLILSVVLLAVAYGLIVGALMLVPGGPIISILLSLGLFVCFFGVFSLFVGVMLRAVLYRSQRASFGSHLSWMRQRFWSAAKVVLLQQLVISNSLYILAGMFLFLFIVALQSDFSLLSLLTGSTSGMVITFSIVFLVLYLLSILLTVMLTACAGWALFLFVSARATGLASVTASVALVRGRVWPVFWRLLFLGFLAVAFIIVLTILVGLSDVPDDVAELLPTLFQFLSIPFLVSASVLLFESLCATQQPVSDTERKNIQRRVKIGAWTGAGAVAIYIVSIGLLFFVLFTFISAVGASRW